MSLRRPDARLYNRLFVLGFFYNFVIGLNFNNNAIYPLWVEEMGGGAREVGLFMGIASFAAVAGRPLIGPLIDRKGVRPVMTLGAIAMTLPSIGFWLLLGQGLTPAVWALRALYGFGFGAHFSAFFALAAQVAPPDRRNESIAMFGLSGMFSNLIGPFLGEMVFEQLGPAGFFAMVTAFGLAGLSLARAMKVGVHRDAQQVMPTLPGSMRLLRTRPLLLAFALALLLALCFSTPSTFLGPLARERAIESFGLYFTGMATAGVSIRLLGRKWGDRYGVRRILVPAFLLYGSAMAALYMAESTAAVVAAGLLGGAAHGLAFPAVQSLGYGRAPAGYGGSAIALITGMMDAGAMATAVGLGVVAQAAGYPVPFLVAAFGGLLASLLTLISVLRDPHRLRLRPAR